MPTYVNIYIICSSILGVNAFLKEDSYAHQGCIYLKCSKTFIYLSALIVPFKTGKLPIPYALMHPHTIRDAGFWPECW